LRLSPDADTWQQKISTQSNRNKQKAQTKEGTNLHLMRVFLAHKNTHRYRMFRPWLGGKTK